MMHCLVLLIHIRCFLPPSLMFWINTGPGDRATIEKSWMDASERSSLAVITAQSAHSLTADVAARRLYWISDFKRVRFGSKAQMFFITHGACCIETIFICCFVPDQNCSDFFLIIRNN